MHLARFVSAVVVGVSLAAACGPTAPAELAKPGGHSARTGLAHNDLHHNSLDAAALGANAGLRAKLAGGPLSSEAIREAEADAALVGQLLDSRTLELMKYVVSCALPPGASVKRPAGAPAGDDWAGEVGLCAGWANEAPAASCLELVSACVLARVNAHDKRVIISMRGQPAALFPLQPRVPVETELREEGGTPIRSFDPLDKCVGPLPSGGTAARDCGFAPLLVGRCQAGEAVTVCTGGKEGAAAACGCDDAIPDLARRAALRVCKGLYGCDAEDFAPPRAYAGPLPDAKDACPGKGRPAVTFTCPTNGPLVDPASGADRRYGYYSVMIAPGDAAPTQAPKASVGAGVNATTGQYPAPEADVFTYREGAFYGNLFSSAGIQGKQQMLAGDSYACFSSVWRYREAELADRFCGGVEGCFEHAPGPCFQAAGQRCKRDDGAPGASYGACLGLDGAPRWTAPVTVYLNHPCDLTGACDKGEAVGNTGAPPPQ